MLYTDKKISKQATDRTLYFAPTDNGTLCTSLKVDAAGEAVRVDMDTDPSVVKMQRCVCTQPAPLCSYHLGDGNMDPADPSSVQDYYCRRYEIWSDDKEIAPVDTHQRKLSVKNNNLGWHK